MRVYKIQQGYGGPGLFVEKVDEDTLQSAGVHEAVTGATFTITVVEMDPGVFRNLPDFDGF
jgi:hypothetical protein